MSSSNRSSVSREESAGALGVESRRGSALTSGFGSQAHGALSADGPAIHSSMKTPVSVQMDHCAPCASATLPQCEEAVKESINTPTHATAKVVRSKANTVPAQIHRGGAAAAPEHTHTVVRLKPKLKKVPSAYIRYTAEPITQRPLPGVRGAIALPAARSLGPEGGNTVVTAAGSHASASASPPLHAARLPRGLSSHDLWGAATGTMLTVTGPSASGGEGAGDETLRYEVDEVFGPEVADDEVCASVVPGVLQQMESGYNVCVLCYGQTGSGKTHTINALIPPLVDAIFASTVDASNDVVEVSYIQIYANTAYDLLGDATEKELFGTPLPRPKGEYVYKPKHLVHSAAEAVDRINRAQRMRFTSSHALNARSSRSHTLLSIHVTRYLAGAPLLTTKATLVDLAGTERSTHPGAVGDGLEEANAIHSSLCALRGTLDPTEYDAPQARDSVLALHLSTRMMEWHRVLIITSSLERSHFQEMRSALEFAATAKCAPVVKQRVRTADHDSGPGSQSIMEACAKLNNVIGVLRDRVQLLEEELALEMERGSRRRRITTSPPRTTSGCDSPASMCSPQSTTRPGARDGGPQSSILAGDVSVATTLDSESTATVNGGDDDAAEVEAAFVLETTANTMAAGAEIPVEWSARVRRMQRQHAKLEAMLRDHEEYLSSHTFDNSGQGVRGLVQAQAEEREKVCRLLETLQTDPSGCGNELAEGATDVFLQLHWQVEEMREQHRVMEKTLDAVRAEVRRSFKEEMNTQKELMRQEAHCDVLEEAVTDSRRVQEGLRRQLEDTRLQLSRCHVEWGVWVESLQLYKGGQGRDEERQRELQCAHEEQRALCDNLQSRLSSTEQELYTATRKADKLTVDLKQRIGTFKFLWGLLTPHQRARFNEYSTLSINGTDGVGDPLCAATTAELNPLAAVPTTLGSAPVPSAAERAATGSSGPSLLQGYSEVQLRASVQRLQTQLSEEAGRTRQRDLEVEQLRAENEVLLRKCASKDSQYRSLKEREQLLVGDSERLSVQLNDSFNYIVGHITTQEKRLIEQVRAANTELQEMHEVCAQYAGTVARLQHRLDVATQRYDCDSAQRDAAGSTHDEGCWTHASHIEPRGGHRRYRQPPFDAPAPRRGSSGGSDGLAVPSQRPRRPSWGPTPQLDEASRGRGRPKPGDPPHASIIPTMTTTTTSAAAVSRKNKGRARDSEAPGPSGGSPAPSMASVKERRLRALDKVKLLRRPIKQLK